MAYNEQPILYLGNHPIGKNERTELHVRVELWLVNPGCSWPSSACCMQDFF